jgi:hypothetical protein
MGHRLRAPKRTKEQMMSKRQRGNKEPKKPKQERPPPVPVTASIGVTAAAPPVRLKRK